MFNNRISIIENLDSLVNLQVFSIGNNDIKTLDSLSYLIRFENLRVLNLSGNQVSREANYKEYCLAHFKRLNYLDYRLIDQQQVTKAREKFVDSIIALEEEENTINQKRIELEKQAQVDKIHSVKSI